MIKNEKDGVVYYTFEKLSNIKGLTHGFSTKIGGVSKNHFESMNLSFSRGDSKDDVMENFRLIAKAIGFKLEDIVFSDQCHEINVKKVGKEDRGKGIIIEKRLYKY